jgi:DNA (cytosine-5)-methyltransferase 1
MKKMRVADFFCGAGGFSEGFRQKGFDVVFALDNWKPAIDTHELNHPECDSRLINILELDTPEKIDEVVPDTEVIVGSPPCISFSNSNRSGKADKSLGLELIRAFLRIVAWKKSKGVLKYWIMENVPNSKKHTKDRYSWNELGLPGKGPSLEVPNRVILNSRDFGAPQSRKRFISGDFPLPKESHSEYITIRDVFMQLGNPVSKPKKKINDPLYKFRINSKDLTDHYYDSRVSDFEWQKAKRLKLDHGYMGKMSFPENIDRPSRTVMATMSASTRESLIFYSFSLNFRKNGYRLPTVREAGCFMSFPITYQFEGGSESVKYRLVGNAVCPKLSAALATAILNKEKKRDISPKWKMGQKASINLNGFERKNKTLKKRNLDAKFDHHIPYLKIRNYRVSLDNIESDFKEGTIQWNCVLHHGTGQDAKKMIISPSHSKKLIEEVEGIDKFDRELNEFFKNLKINHERLQEDYIENNPEKGPYAILLKLKKIIDSNYPEQKAGDININHREKGIDMGNCTMPLRICVATHACSKLVSFL